MTAQEVANELGKSLSTIETSFPRTKKNLEKQGIILNRTGYGKNKDYTITYTERYETLINQKFGRLTVLEKAESIFVGGKKRGAFKCKCDCGKEIIVLREKLISGNTKSCGCLREETYKNNINNISNQRFGRLIALYPTEERKWRDVVWHCQCDCGNTTNLPSHSLLSGNTQSCGCLNSKGEQKIISILQQNKISYIKEKTFDDLPKLRFDFYVNNQYIIEYDGIQHFITKNSYWDTEEHLKRTKENDELKNEYCKEHNIPLIRIPYIHLSELNIKDLLLETTNWRVV